jgi:hypothetical protein
VWWSLVLTAFGLTGLWLTPRRPGLALVVGWADQVLWVAFALVSDNPFFVISALVYARVYWSNFRRSRSLRDLSRVLHSEVRELPLPQQRLHLPTQGDGWATTS